MSGVVTRPFTPLILGISGAASSITGTASETTLATVVVPGGMMGPNGALRIWSLWSYTNSANGKTLRIRLNGLGTQAIMGANVSTSGVYSDIRYVFNNNANNSQKAWQFSALGGTSISTTTTTASIDTTAAISLVFTGNLTNTGETITLESYCVELLRRG